MDPVQGQGFARFNVSSFFTQEYIDTLVQRLPAEGSISLISNHQDITALELPGLGVDPQLVRPLMDYAQTLVKELNESLPEIERGRMDIELLRIAISDGTKAQINEDWHIDSTRYFSLVTNLAGAGTLIDARGPKAAPESGRIDSEPEHIGQLRPREALLMNGYIRQFMFDSQPGSWPTVHRAPPGQTQMRLGLVLFISPKTMNSGVLRRKLLGTIQRPDRLRAEYLNPIPE